MLRRSRLARARATAAAAAGRRAAAPAPRQRGTATATAAADAPAGVTVVSTRSDAERVLAIVAQLPATTYHAWDTEVADIDLANQGPVGHGRVVCASFYSGPDVDYGAGPCVWIDNLDAAEGLLLAFKPLLESERVRKVWHNYGFDRHVVFNHGIDARGFAGDTMHMARLWNTALKQRGGYSLEGLCALLLGRRKTPMGALFALPKLKQDGTLSKVTVLPPVDEIQRSAASRERWIAYSALDAELTWRLREELEARLRGRRWVNDQLSMFHFYERYIRPFGEVLTDLERAGIYVDVQGHLPQAERLALQERVDAEATFLAWAAQLCPDAAHLNVGSDVQKAHFLFAPCERLKPGSRGAKREAEAAALAAASSSSASGAAAAAGAGPGAAAAAPSRGAAGKPGRPPASRRGSSSADAITVEPDGAALDAAAAAAELPAGAPLLQQQQQQLQQQQAQQTAQQQAPAPAEASVPPAVKRARTRKAAVAAAAEAAATAAAAADATPAALLAGATPPDAPPASATSLLLPLDASGSSAVGHLHPVPLLLAQPPLPSPLASSVAAGTGALGAESAGATPGGAAASVGAGSSPAGGAAPPAKPPRAARRPLTSKLKAAAAAGASGAGDAPAADGAAGAHAPPPSSNGASNDAGHPQQPQPQLLQSHPLANTSIGEGHMQRLGSSSSSRHHGGGGGGGADGAAASHRRRGFFSFGSAQLTRMAAQQQQRGGAPGPAPGGLDPRLLLGGGGGGGGGGAGGAGGGGSGPPSHAQHTGRQLPPYAESSEDSDYFRAALGGSAYSDDSDSGGGSGGGLGGDDGEAAYSRYGGGTSDGDEAGGSGGRGGGAPRWRSPQHSREPAPPATYLEALARRRRSGGSDAAAAAAQQQQQQQRVPADGAAPPAPPPPPAASFSRDADCWPVDRPFKIDNTDGYVAPGAKGPRKYREITLTGLGIPPVSRTEQGWPAASSGVLKVLAGKIPQPPPGAAAVAAAAAAAADAAAAAGHSGGAGAPPATRPLAAGAGAPPPPPPPKPLPPPVYGSAYDYFGGGAEGAAACTAIDALYRVSAIDTMLSNFIVPLQLMADGASRVHCSLNLNTETGRLSARRPNLQNQPALEKDRFGVRKAFAAPPGRKLICADYGQLELRLLAHMAKCGSMLRAFASGGDFHSRTAAGMYPYVQAAIDDGRVLLEEAEGGGGSGGAPLLKNVYATERRKAKVLNFSIAYGKTAMGLSKDWGVSLGEARDTVERWYADRPEVRAWQAAVLESARAEACTRTLLGRYRDLPEINAPDVWARRHSERAAINTPIQGGAADVAMMAMLKLARNEALAAAGWRMLLQIHDEVILEGPAGSAADALRLVVADMTQPFAQPLLVELAVDAKVVDTWYEAK